MKIQDFKDVKAINKEENDCDHDWNDPRILNLERKVLYAYDCIKCKVIQVAKEKI